MSSDLAHALAQNEELALWNAWRQRTDLSARERLVTIHMGLVRSISASIYRAHSLGYVDFAELVQLGSVGLLDSIARFDPAHGVSFAAFASKRIRGEILTGLEQTSEVHAQLGYRRRIRKERTASLADSAKAQHGTDVFLQMVDLALGLAVGHMLEGTLMFVDERHEPATEASVQVRETSQGFARLIDRLPEAERQVLRYHYLQGFSFTAVAELMGLSKGRISQLHSKALKSLRVLHRNRQRIDLEI